MAKTGQEPGTTSDNPNYRYARGPAKHGHHRVSFVELFFDLVFVFAVTQVAHHLIEHPTPLGVYETLLLTMAVWWVWIYTSWSTNWADPDKIPVRMMLFAVMALGLVMSMSIPTAFGERALPFALAFAGMQVGRSLFMYRKVMGELSEHHQHNFLLLTIWVAVTGALWIIGALIGGVAQIVLWTIAVAIEYAGPAMRFVVPGIGRAKIEAWEIEPGHFAERCGLFIILVLGESVLVTGATFAKLAWTLPTWLAFIGAFTTTLGMWSIYFNIGQERGVFAMAEAHDSGLVARSYTYVHLLIVAGIIVTAAGDEFALAHATGHVDVKSLATIVGGPALFLLGCTLFKRATAGWFPLSHLVGLGLLAVVAVIGTIVEPWMLTMLTSAVLIGVSIWEHISLGPDAVKKIGHPSQRAKDKAVNAG